MFNMVNIFVGVVLTLIVTQVTCDVPDETYTKLNELKKLLSNNEYQVYSNLNVWLTKSHDIIKNYEDDVHNKLKTGMEKVASQVKRCKLEDKIANLSEEIEGDFQKCLAKVTSEADGYFNDLDLLMWGLTDEVLKDEERLEQCSETKCYEQLNHQLDEDLELIPERVDAIVVERLKFLEGGIHKKLRFCDPTQELDDGIEEVMKSCVN
ncbi:uncharacterized protein LOC126265007 [Aethina tumida]|uniref:uncharacterized protein LOC126265007 n=1 Tax=Aethina tumida TaxID=116153 RepID=UPI002147E50F|nr:uncharacterized protein LOC126265007 [Aethina tumida]